MEVKELYLDLREGPQYAKNNKNIWLLESEIFKDPLKIKLGYDDNDKREIERIKKDCLEIKENLKKEYDKVYKLIEQQTNILENLRSLKIDEQKIIDSYKEMQNEEKEKRKEIKKSKEEIYSKNDELWDKIQELFTIMNKKPDRKIFMYHSSEFVSWLDPYYWEDIKIPSWTYHIIEKKHYIPQNEYCINQDTVNLFTRVIENVYNPEIQLEWSNGIDKPVAQVEIDILFFQI